MKKNYYRKIKEKAETDQYKEVENVFKEEVLKGYLSKTFSKKLLPRKAKASKQKSIRSMKRFLKVDLLLLVVEATQKEFPGFVIKKLRIKSNLKFHLLKTLLTSLEHSLKSMKMKLFPQVPNAFHLT